jgi:hypothetical protein
VWSEDQLKQTEHELELMHLSMPSLAANLPVPVDRDDERLGGVPVEAALLADLLLSRGTHPARSSPVASQRRGLLVGMRPRFRSLGNRRGAP